MRSATLVLTALALVPGQGAFAHGSISSPTVHSSCCESPARWEDRQDPRDARIAIVTEDDDAMLVLTDDVVAVQLSDRVMRKVRRELRKEEDLDDDNALAHAIKAAVLSGVRALLDHSAVCSIRDLRDVDYRHGRLVFTTEDGERIFDDIDVNGEDVMSGFSDRDARVFVREFRRIKAHRR
jgi:hypothetical protein